MDHSTYPKYNSKEALVLDLKDFICRCPTRVMNFNAAITSAIAEGPDEMRAEGINDLDAFLLYCEKFLRWVPNVSSSGDELLRKLLIFYWVFDQPTILHLQTPVTPETSNNDLSWLSYWLVSFARQLGKFLDTPESAGLVYTFYLNSKYNEEALKWEQPETGWVSFNHWFGRHWKDIQVARPVDSPLDDKVITMPADSVYDNNWPIEKGEVDLKLKIKGIEHKWPIKDLLRTTDTTWDEGHFTHSFLGPADYHRQHAPVSGTVIEARVIQNQVYLQVAKNKKTGKIYADRAMVRAPTEIKRRQGVRVQYESEGEGGGDESPANPLEEDLDAPDDPGYQWCQTRGLIVIQTKKYGKVAILPIGMAQVSSVWLSVKAGDPVNKGDEISYFQFGGSDCVMVFEKRVHFLYSHKKKVNVRKQIATFLE
jgi:phosphatidylserine decarboxylase